MAFSASSSWIFALSSRIIFEISMVGAVAQIGPLYPMFTRTGKKPLWSRWPWVSTTKSISEIWMGSWFQFNCRIFFIPWNKPQSTKIFFSEDSIRNLLPVTVPAAPRKWRVTDSLINHSSCYYDYRCFGLLSIFDSFFENRFQSYLRFRVFQATVNKVRYQPQVISSSHLFPWMTNM